MKNILKTLGGFLLDFIQTIVTALSIFIIVYLFLFQPHQVKGNSMHTALSDSFDNGEYILTNKVNYRFNKPQRGDVIVFKAPHNEDYDYIKRIIGLPGETVKILNGRVYINGLPFDESEYLPSSTLTSAGKFLKEGEEVAIPADKYFVLGDNRSHSSDSRDWGFVNQDNIVGKAWFVYWPLQKLGLVKH
jgi:signal peptidase I